MIALIIAVEGECVRPVLASMSEHAPSLTPCRWSAVTPDQVAALEIAFSIHWTYPDHGQATLYGLRCHSYKGDASKRRAVFWSHFTAWKQCVDLDQAVIVLESDALFIRAFDPETKLDPRFGMVSLNDPRGATRLAGLYHHRLQEAKALIVPVPWVDAQDVPQGLPGHSAYALEPWFARELIAKAHAIGAWPNDALACKQFFPAGQLGCLRHYATKTSGRPSTIR